MANAGIPGELAGEGSYKRGRSKEPLNDVQQRWTVGWEPGCKCSPAEPVPCTVLDPFSGSGTTGAVALRLGRDYIGIDLKAEYLPLATARLENRSPPEPQGDVPIMDLLAE